MLREVDKHDLEVEEILAEVLKKKCREPCSGIEKFDVNKVREYIG